MQLSLKNRLLIGALALGALWPSGAVHALDLTKGLMYAVPVPNGKPPVIDGKLDDWDLSAAEPGWISPTNASIMNLTVALEYDADNLYVCAHVHTPSHEMLNPNNPVDKFWAGDELELRLCTDSTLPRPLNRSNPVVAASNRVCHLTFWKNTVTGKDYLAVVYGANLNLGHVYDPEGSKVAIVPGDSEYTMEAKIPWSALNAPGGKNPIPPGGQMTAIWGVHFHINSFFISGNLLYTSDPGDFAFHQTSTWGQVEFSPTGHLPKRHPSMEEALAAANKPASGVPITVNVPEDGKLSVNIFSPDGKVIRELAGGQPVKKGPYSVLWDGYDQWGFPVNPGKYKWGAYFSHGLKAVYDGFVGSSGDPPYSTPDNKGGWGGDHGVPTCVATDASGAYLAWNGGEAQADFVKIDPQGHTVWRKSPLVTTFHLALASNGASLYVVSDGAHPKLARLDATTGALIPLNVDPNGSAETTLPAGTPAKIPGGSLPMTDSDGTEPECLGLAASAKEVFASIHSLNQIVVVDANTGATLRTLNCPGPRGLALAANGDLFAISFPQGGPGQILRFAAGQGAGAPVVTTGLDAPVGLSVDPAGKLYVTECGTDQQLQEFDGTGKLVSTIGKPGGRAHSGTYDPGALLDPFGVSADGAGHVYVAEASIPKIFDEFDTATGATVNRWYGWPGYGVSNVADCDDPFTNYFPYEPRGFGRATAPEGGTGYPTAYWGIDYDRTNPEGVYVGGGQPMIQRLSNGQKYFICDSYPHMIYLIQGDNLVPAGYIRELNGNENFRGVTNPTGKTFIELWIDKNGDHKVQDDEVTTITAIDGKPIPHLETLHRAYALDMDEKGDAYLQTDANSIIEIPSDGVDQNGAIRWNADKVHYVVPLLVPGLFGGAGGMVKGMRTDSAGNVYATLNTTVPGLTPVLEQKLRAAYPNLAPGDWGVFASQELATAQREGLGHTGESNMIKFAKYAPDGHLLWIAGRKALAAPNPGEMYNTWGIAGMVGDDYVASTSEWGLTYFYTSDGFYVDSLYNDSATLPPPGPQTFGSETFGGGVKAFPKLGEVFSYNQGAIFKVAGFDKTLHVEGEQRLTGTVNLDHVYESPLAPVINPGAIQIAPIGGAYTAANAWAKVPTETLTRSSLTLATAQVAYDANNLYARIHVVDDTPLQNSADGPDLAFKGGDSAGLDLGPAPDPNQKAPIVPVTGDIRLLAVMLHGQPHLVAMKPFSTVKHPRNYFTPAGGHKNFDFVDDVPGGNIQLTPDADGKGYTALFSVPRDFLEFPITPTSSLAGDIEVLLSGTGPRGMQAVARNWLYEGGISNTTMTDDLPTESWLYPKYWGPVTVK